MKPWMIEAMALGLIVLALGAAFLFVCAIAFPPDDDDGPRGGGMVE